MSVMSEIERIKNAKSALKTSIENKGVSVGDGLINTYAGKVDEIEGGNYNAYKVATIQERDAIKRELCDKNGIKVLYFSNLKIQYPYPVITKEEELIKILLNN